MLKNSLTWRVVITGPESTGKTALAKALSGKWGSPWIPEYARQYVENLDHKYSFDDVVAIAEHQIGEEAIYSSEFRQGVLFFDTWLIITKVWFDLVFGKCPEWIIEHIRSSKIDLFLVCDTDLPWVADAVRENGGEKREKLLHIYCNEIRSFGFKYEIITGFGPVRMENALKALSKHGLNLTLD